MAVLSDVIQAYWEGSPPHKGEGEVGSLEWSQAISEHRHKVVPYLKDFINAEQYKGKLVFEIGYGAGSDLIEFSQAGAEVIGVDITDKAQELTNMRLKAHGLGEAYPTKYNGKNLEGFADNTADLVYSNGVLHHTPYMDDLLAEAYRILKPKGTLKLMLYHKNSILYYYSILYRRFKEGLTCTRDGMLSKYSEFREGCPYTRVFSVHEIREKLSYFSSCRVWTDYCVYDDGVCRKLDAHKRFDVEKTGIVDIDNFFEEFNHSVELNNPLTDYGWHLLVEATKR